MLDALVDLCRATPDRAAHGPRPRPRPGRPDRPQRRLRTRPTPRADRIYTGVLYDALDLGDALAGRQARGRPGWLAITSSLFGLVRPGDRIPAYRLSGDVRLPGLGSVARRLARPPRPGGRRRLGGGPAGRPPVDDVRRLLAAACRRWRDGSPPSGCCTRRTASARSSATSTRPPRAASSARCSSTAATPAPPAALADLLRDLGWKVEVGAARPRRHPARRRRQRDLEKAKGREPRSLPLQLIAQRGLAARPRWCRRIVGRGRESTSTGSREMSQRDHAARSTFPTTSPPRPTRR